MQSIEAPCLPPVNHQTTFALQYVNTESLHPTCMGVLDMVLRILRTHGRCTLLGFQFKKCAFAFSPLLKRDRITDNVAQFSDLRPVVKNQRYPDRLLDCIPGYVFFILSCCCNLQCYLPRPSNRCSRSTLSSAKYQRAAICSRRLYSCACTGKQTSCTPQ